MFDAAFYARRYSLGAFETADLYKHYVYVGRFVGYDPNEYFSTSWYLGRYKDVKVLRLDPLDHYLESGAAEGRDPGPAFSSSLYRMLYPDVAASGSNPLLHFLDHGRREGRFAPPVALLPGLSVMSDPAAVLALDPCLVTSARPIALALMRWSTLLVQGDASGVPALPADTTHGPSPPAPEPSGIAPAPAEACPLPPVRHGARRAARPDAARVIARRSPWLVKGCAAFFARDLAASFRAVRLLGRLPAPVEGPVVLVTNHPSWWDAELYHWLAATSFPDRRGFAPMDAGHLARHPLLTRLGAFPVRPGSFSGAAAFLSTAERILGERDAILLVAVEGRFRDVRDRPIRPMPGIAHLARRVPEATFIPLAIDYVFWGERRPNLLLRFGEPIRAGTLAGGTAATGARLASALEAAMSALAEAGQSRQPLRFATLLEGRGGVSVTYDLWQKVAERLRRRPPP